VLHAPVVLPAPSEGRRWRSAPARRSGSTLAEVQRPAAQEEEWALPASGLVEPEALEASNPVLPAAGDGEETAAAAGTAGVASAAAAAVDADIGDECCCPKRMEPSSSSYPQSLPALTLGVEGSINQLVEVVEAVVQQRILDVIIQPFLEVLLLIAITGDISGGVAGKLKETVTVLRHRYRSLK
jgi:hypothetical protein